MAERLHAHARTFSSKSDFTFLIDRASEFMRELDEKCQEDRMACTVKPMCEKRRWLSILIKAGDREVPRFCYELQQKIVERSLNKEKYFYEPEDCAIFLDDFFLLVTQSSPYKLAKMLENEEYDALTATIEAFFRTKFNRILSHDFGESLVILADDIFWYFDYIDKYVILNVNDERILNQSNLLSVAKLLIRYYRLDIKIFESTPEAWLLDLVLFEIKSPEVAQNVSLKAILAEQIGKLSEVALEANFKVEESKARIITKINAFCGLSGSMYAIEPVTYGELLRCFQGLSACKKKIDAWVAKNPQK